MSLSQTVHIPILRDTIVNYLVDPFLKTQTPSVLIDCTFGGGGHSGAFLKALPKIHKVVSIDQDAEAIERGKINFKNEIDSGRLTLIHGRFSSIESLSLNALGLMADLGFSSDQLDNPKRGLSFLKEGPLDMRLDPESGVSAYDFLKKIREPELVQILSELGEERFSRRIASAIILAQKSGKLPKTTTELADLISRSVPPPARHGRIHAATRSFQAIRIAVNQELDELDALLTRGILKVSPGGRVAILSFHSLEDRKVKETFKNKDLWTALTKKPIEASPEEIEHNSRARSAKLRVAEKK